MKKVDCPITAEQFLDGLDKAFRESDREQVNKLSKIAFECKNILWQSAVRHVDNAIIASRQNNNVLLESCMQTVEVLTRKIRAEATKLEEE